MSTKWVSLVSLHSSAMYIYAFPHLSPYGFLRSSTNYQQLYCFCVPTCLGPIGFLSYPSFNIFMCLCLATSTCQYAIIAWYFAHISTPPSLFLSISPVFSIGRLNCCVRMHIYDTFISTYSTSYFLFFFFFSLQPRYAFLTVCAARSMSYRHIPEMLSPPLVNLFLFLRHLPRRPRCLLWILARAESCLLTGTSWRLPQQV